LTDRITRGIFTPVMSPDEITELLDRTPALNDYIRSLTQPLHDEIAALKGELEWLKRQVFGQKTERFIAPDCQTALELGVSPQTPPMPMERISYERAKPRKHTPHGRGEIPAHLPRSEIVIEPEGDTSAMERIGEKVTEQLEYKPPEYYVTRYVRPVFAGERDGVRTVLCGELPALCNDKGKYGASIIAQVTVAKFEDHIPVYRVRKQILRDSGMDIAETSLDALVEKAAFWMSPIAERLRVDVMASGYVQVDETRLPVMIRPTNGKSTTGQLWLRHSPERCIVAFDYQRRRTADVAQQLLQGYQGILQSDGYVVYDAFSRTDGVAHACCNAHARRGFDESLTNDRSRATHALEQYRKLFAIEDEARKAGLSPPQRLALRQENSAPIAAAFKSWLDAQVAHVIPKSPIGKAVLYCLNRWRELTRFLEDGRIELSSNLVENCVRPCALGRKNWLFAGSEDGARRMATIYTVAVSAKLHGLNTFDYFTHILRELPKRTSGDIDDLLPTTWRQ